MEGFRGREFPTKGNKTHSSKLPGKFEGREIDILLSALPVPSLDQYWKPACVLHSCSLPSISLLIWIIFIASVVCRLWFFLSCSTLWATAGGGSASHQVHTYPDCSAPHRRLFPSQAGLPFCLWPHLRALFVGPMLKLL